MKKVLAISLLVFLLGYAVWEFQFKEPVIGLESGNAAPDFTLETIRGETVTLSDLKGKKVLLNFWATWCPPCREEMPAMEKIHEGYGESVVVLAVNFTSSESSRENVSQFVNDLELTFPVVLDNEGINADYQIFNYPTTYVLNEDGIIESKYVGGMTYDIMKNLLQL
ncbi:redoxin domain-containing protein [Bacillus lacus]|uniref:Redoxin domain-containing protein n=1 Tax=Metabacillus lacus TaxID=1983721 RepID=A0A7X2IVT5_9BACI|nr:TlpA disulfide reductase family protein [Metabacillus lacus]MRX70712.1 redoxin domain-containing protein [Metabacillus lacus]